MSYILLFIVCTAIHNCSSLGSLVFAILGQNVKRDNMTIKYNYNSLYMLSFNTITIL